MKKSEKVLQDEVLFWLNSQKGVFAIRIDNSAPFDERVGARIKKSKWTPKGVPDILVMLSIGKLYWIEMKDDDGVQSKEQIAFEKKMLDFKIGYYVIRNVAEAQASLERELSC